MLGERLGKWVIFKELGQGGMGQVYLAQEEIGGRQAAIKILAPELAQEGGFLHRFQREIETLSVLDHPGIVRFYEAGYENAVHFYAMEYVDGQSLEKILAEKRRLSWQETLDIALQICPALRHVHNSGVIHRDLKPANILRTNEGRIKITDFGIAKVFASSHLTATGGVVGTAEYLSPEQAAGKPVSKRSDLYSLGVVLYALLTGRTPFDGQSFVELLHKHRYAQFERPGRLLPELPYEVDEVICQLLEKDPDKRPADCLVLGKQLERIRRKLDRKSQPTQDYGGRTIGEGGGVDGDEGVAPGPATLMSRLMRQELDRQNQGGVIARLFNQAWFLAVVLALVLGILAWTFWPASAESLFAEGSALMQSPRPADWERAWSEYFEPLERRFPEHPYREEVAAFHKKIEAARSPYPSEAQRFFLRGQELQGRGDLAGARRTWQDLVAVFAHADAEKVWVDKAENALAELDKEAGRKERWQSVRPALERAARLRAGGRRAEAERIWSALEALYRDDPYAADVLAEIAATRQAKN